MLLLWAEWSFKEEFVPRALTLVAFSYITIPKKITKEDGFTVVNEIPHQKH